MLKRPHQRRLLIALLLLAAVLAFHSWLVGRLIWKRTLRAAGFVGEMAAPAEGDRILVVAPHPDDEMLGCGGLIQQAIVNGAQVHVVLMTNGDASEWSAILGEREVPWKPKNMINLGRTRQQESLRALVALGLDASHVHFLSFPNNGLLALWRPEHWRRADLYQSPYTHASISPYENSFTPRAPYCGEQVLSDLMAILAQVRPTRIYVSHPRDIHSDHWATNCFVSYALATAAVKGATWAETAQVWGYLVHWPRFPAPGQGKVKLDLLPPPELSGEQAQWYRLPLTPEEAQRKLAAVRSYRSQTPRFDRILLSFPRQDEIFELVSPEEVSAGSITEWLTVNSPRRGLEGAEVKGLRLQVRDDLTAWAELTTAQKRIPQRGYVCLDLRTWDQHGAPIITTLYLRGRGAAEAVRLEPTTGPRPLSGVVVAEKPGKLEVQRLPLPLRGLAEAGLFVTCFGSVQDRYTDPAVVSWVKFRPPAP